MSLEDIARRQRKQLRVIGIALIVLGLALVGGGINEMVTEGGLGGDYFWMGLLWLVLGGGAILRSRK